ncbi:YdjC family protein [Gemmatirosa kalamazoonensis]|uniref:YdjC family protein n=1 Tax=Gemmatirosa kalamazoonensis TaxID=861299 RepID=W0RFK6_9BACT|nr:polysaccharide deacetylase family protein [Gemmatirosa kalamazoonensis]AHG88173.1 YdjC family protein [Gemmatirosa kalamazoonensis]
MTSRPLSIALASMLLAAAASAQPTVAERLGYPRDAKLLILHADDLGVAHSVNAASFDALDRGAVSSASVMMPTPWVTEVAAYARAHPDADIGLHLTLTSEWETYRWGPLASRDAVRGLVDSAGTLWKDTPLVTAHATPAEAEREVRAQIEAALRVGIRPTHIDSHMGSLFTTPEMIAVIVRLGHEYGLPFLGLRVPAFTAAGLAERDVIPDAVVMADENVPRDRWKQFYVDAVKSLKPGLTEMIVHLGHDDAELQAVMVNHEPYGSAWRQRDYDVVTSPEFRRALDENHVVLVKWRDIQKLTAPR